jgi:hypothetical protein
LFSYKPDWKSSNIDKQFWKSWVISKKFIYSFSILENPNNKGENMFYKTKFWKYRKKNSQFFLLFSLNHRRNKKKVWFPLDTLNKNLSHKISCFSVEHFSCDVFFVVRIKLRHHFLSQNANEKQFYISWNFLFTANIFYVLSKMMKNIVII